MLSIIMLHKTSAHSQSMECGSRCRECMSNQIHVHLLQPIDNPLQLVLITAGHGLTMTLFSSPPVCHSAGAPFFNKTLWKAVKNLRKHIAAGCISDEPGVTLYHALGRALDGCTRWHCFRGTNNVENYHLPLRRLLSSYGLSPQLAHSILLAYNYRHNLRMAIKHRGLSPEFGGLYSQHILEDLQELTAGWFAAPLFQGWQSTNGFVDTGERTGLVASIDLSKPKLNANSELLCTAVAVGTPAAPPRGGMLGAGGRATAPVLPALATDGARQYARMQGLGGAAVLPFTAVITKAERDKVEREWPNFLLTQVERHARQAHTEAQSLDFVAWASQWNADVASLEAACKCGQLELEGGQMPIMRKHAVHLRDYWAILQSKDNIKSTMASHRSAQGRLRQLLRAAEVIGPAVQTPAVAATDTGQASPPPAAAAAAATAAATAAAAATVAHVSGGSVHIPAAILDVALAVSLPTLPAAAAATSSPAVHVPPLQQSARAVRLQIISTGTGGGATLAPRPSALDRSDAGMPYAHEQPFARKRRPAVCQTCGHLSMIGHYGILHNPVRTRKFAAGARECPEPLAEHDKRQKSKSARTPYARLCECQHCVEAIASHSAIKKQKT
eukprot:TRINITY_DN201_c0_g1_i1.p1 TRINITY_DN201_c0_g1~~TRINITY_DN201_c0_g1_i1.p1  ORF type:complete len:615 (-),score=71.10 TRINITY_DN201_c0_g1_i1:36-1880(-)